MATAVEPHDTHHDNGHGHDDWHHKPFSAHHFENAEQQFDSGKLGMWIFLVTEILFFSGLFCAYAVLRSNHPDVFIYASHYLDKYLGGLNTIVLLFSSLTIAWAVRCAQLGQQKGLVAMLGVTLACAALFLGVKTFEYTEKAHKRLMWAGAYIESKDIGKNLGTTEKPGEHLFLLGKEPEPAESYHERVAASLVKIQWFWAFTCLIPAVIIGAGYVVKRRHVRTIGYCVLVSILSIMAGIFMSVEINKVIHPHTDKSHAKAESPEEEKLLADAHTQHVQVAGDIVDPMLGEETSNAIPEGMKTSTERPKNANLFFSIYYFMTGLHAFHIVCGMIAISWLLVRAVEGHFRPDYFGPVDFVALYWHIVDLIWIYLFPLLYLIKH